MDTFAKWVYEINGEGGWLSMDHYPLRRTLENEFYIYESWFTDVETTAKAAKKYRLKPYFFLQSMAFGGSRYYWNDRTPTKEDLSLQMYTYLAYGAKGFSHFCYQTPTTDEFYERQSGLFDKGAPTERWYYSCDKCNEEYTEAIPAIGHTNEEMEGVAATCTDEGKTDGVKCSTCDKVIVEPQVLAALGHNPVEDEAVEATCTEDGLTAGKHCERCDVVLEAQEIIPALGHTHVETTSKEPTCTEDGRVLY